MDTEHFYLTNGCCENAGHVGARWMQRIGLEFGEYDGYFYPLTAEEARFIGEDQVAVGDSGMDAWLGYSILYENRKWLAPVVEIDGRNDAAQSARLIHEQVAKRAAEAGGHAFIIASKERFWVEIMLPFELAMAHEDFGGWKAFLEQEFFAAITTTTH